jgi:hypothetical protein
VDALLRERIIDYQTYMEERVVPIEYDYACSECFFLSIVKDVYCDCDECRFTIPCSWSCHAIYERVLK